MKLLALVLVSILGALPLRSADRLFAIDPGHGGNAPSGSMREFTLSSPNNAQTPSGILEKDLTLEMAQDIASALMRLGKQSGQSVQVVLTRSGDENPDFGERARRCLVSGTPPECIVSIHFNASESHAARGAVGMIPAGRNSQTDKDRELASRLSAACASAVSRFLPGTKAREPITDAHLHGGKGSNFFYQIDRISQLRAVPKCFLEIEFIDRADVEENLLKRKSESFPAIAEMIASALLERR